MPSDQGNTTRRRLLKSIGATSLAFGATGVAGARDLPTGELERVKTAYGTPTRVRWAASQHADPVLAELADRGVLERGSVTELDFQNAAVDPFYKDGQAVAHVATETEFDDATVAFVARPETGRVYATVRTDTGDTYTVESAAGTRDVTTQDCWYEHTCDSTYCDSGNGCQKYERQCCDSGCVQSGVGTMGCCSDWYEDGCCPC